MQARTTSVGGRALLALALLLGFYVLAAGVLVGLWWLNAGVVAWTGRVYSALIVFSIVTALAVLRGVGSIVRRVPDEADGVAVSRTQEPRLWQLVDDVARQMGTRAPDELRVVGEVNAYVSESGGRRGRRRMTVGLGLLHVLDADGLRAVVAHELGHYAGGDTRLGPLNYRAGASMGRTIDHLGADSLVGRVFLAYAKLYWRVSLAVRRRQELTADAAAVRIGGRDAHSAALEAVAGAAPAFGFFVDRYVAPVWESGARPANLFEGFARLWADTDRQADLAAVIADARAAEPSPFDSHPSLSQRLANAAELAEAGGARDRSPARALLADAQALEHEVSRQLSERVLGPAVGQAAVLGWTDVAERVFRPSVLTSARGLLDEVAAVDGGSRPATIGRLVALLHTDAVLTLALRLAGDLADVPAERRGEVQASVLKARVIDAVSSALVDGGGARFQVSWSGPLQVVGADGTVLDAAAWVDAALDEDDGPSRLRANLAAAGVPSTWAPAHVPPPAPVQPAPQLVGVLNDVRGGRRATADVLVLADALVVARARTSLRSAMALGAGLGGNVTRTRLERLLDQPLDAILAADPHNRRVPWTDVVAARVTGRAASWTLQLRLADGELFEVAGTTQSPRRKAVVEVVAPLLGDRFTAA